MMKACHSYKTLKTDTQYSVAWELVMCFISADFVALHIFKCLFRSKFCFLKCQLCHISEKWGWNPYTCDDSDKNRRHHYATFQLDYFEKWPSISKRCNRVRVPTSSSLMFSNRSKDCQVCNDSGMMVQF
jgi:hypothetical protein